ncbi:glycosyltransferase family 2 protein [Pyxidicoccus sp. 3LFB2]
MSAQPRFSVVIPCFNQGAFLAECLASLRAQTLPPHEVIVVDDGSTDPYSVQRMDALCVDGVTLLRQENRGLSGARNAGIRAATGDWLVPLDADDKLAPDALATYASAIAGAPEVDVWYPDIQHFGQDTTPWESAPFNPWQLLWGNQLVCSSAIRRRVFDAGVFYNERMRQGYEDWEFFVHACVERGFLARGLERAVFHYRRWGYSMLSESNARRDALVAQLQRERPIYQDTERLLRLKQQHDPYLAIASGSELLRPALDTQATRDFQLVDTTDRVRRDGDLRAFQGHRFARLLVSLEDASLASALRGDAFLLEKMLRVLEEQKPALLWLVTTGPGQAWPGFLLQEHETRGASLRCVGFCVNPALLLDAPPIPRTEAGLVVDLTRHLVERSGTVATMVVGAGPALGPGAPGERAPLDVGPSWRRDLAERKGMLREGVRMVGKGANRMLRGLVGERAHEGLLAQPLVRKLRPGARKAAAPALSLRRLSSRLRPLFPRRRRAATCAAAPSRPRSGCSRACAGPCSTR